MVRKKWGDLSHMHSIKRLERLLLLFAVRKCERQKENCMQLPLNTSRTLISDSIQPRLHR